LQARPLRIVNKLLVDVEEDGDERMITEVLANAGEVMDYGETQAPQVRCRANA
jgi:hypothetical protein